MKSFVFALAIALVSVSASAQVAAPNRIQSINDIPTEFTGIAGDLVTRVDASLKLNRILSATRTAPNVTMANIRYTVDAELNLGGRAIQIKELTLYLAKTGANNDIWLKLDDEFEQNLNLILTYDELTNSFTLKEVGRSRRISLKGVR